jgi:hypothetical protein
VRLGLLIFEVSTSHSDTPNSVGLLWTNDQLVAETLPDNTQDPQETDIHAQAGYEPAIPTSKPLQTHSFDRADPGIGNKKVKQSRYRPGVAQRFP